MKPESQWDSITQPRFEMREPAWANRLEEHFQPQPGLHRRFVPVGSTPFGLVSIFDSYPTSGARGTRGGPGRGRELFDLRDLGGREAREQIFEVVKGVDPVPPTTARILEFENMV
jgi:hypothetical protein